MSLAEPLPRLFCLVGPGDDLSLLGDLADAGVDGFQVRAKGCSDRELLALSALVLRSVRPSGALVVVNDRLDIALAVGADGVHLGAGDLPVSTARRLAPDLVVGATCRDRRMVEQAAADGATYAGFGPVFASSSKTGLPGPRGLTALAECVGVLPLVGIGGIDATTAGAVRGAGAHGAAVIAGLWRQPDPLAAARDLVAAVA